MKKILVVYLIWLLSLSTALAKDRVIEEFAKAMGMNLILISNLTYTDPDSSFIGEAIYVNNKFSKGQNYLVSVQKLSANSKTPTNKPTDILKIRSYIDCARNEMYFKQFWFYKNNQEIETYSVGVKVPVPTKPNTVGYETAKWYCTHQFTDDTDQKDNSAWIKIIDIPDEYSLTIKKRDNKNSLVIIKEFYYPIITPRGAKATDHSFDYEIDCKHNLVRIANEIFTNNGDFVDLDNIDNPETQKKFKQVDKESALYLVYRWYCSRYSAV